MPDPRVLVITSCTGEKRFKSENQLTAEDCRDKARRKEREAELKDTFVHAWAIHLGVHDAIASLTQITT